jgi:hypothetical protein
VKLLICLLLVLYAGSSPAKGLLSQLFQARVVTLQVLSVDNGADLRYATWSDNTDVHLAVIEQAKLTAKITIHEAYQPMLRKIESWQYNKHPVLAFTYRQGAAAEFVELYGIDPKNQFVQLAQILGEQIEWRIGNNGETLLVVYSKPDAVLTPSCYLFDGSNYKLLPAPCV